MSPLWKVSAGEDGRASRRFINHGGGGGGGGGGDSKHTWPKREEEVGGEDEIDRDGFSKTKKKLKAIFFVFACL